MEMDERKRSLNLNKFIWLVLGIQAGVIVLIAFVLSAVTVRIIRKNRVV